MGGHAAVLPSKNYKKYADINITNYKVVNLNKEYYLFQHKDYLPEFKVRSSFEIPENFEPYVDGGNSYALRKKDEIERAAKANR